MNKIQKLSSDFYTKCINCNLCVKRCTMLNNFKISPKNFFKDISIGLDIDNAIPFSCNLCKSCEFVCPKDIDYSKLFFEYRKSLRFKRYTPKKDAIIKFHQYSSFSKTFTYFKPSNPNDCQLVFVPGCSLSSYSPELVNLTENLLKLYYPNIELLIHCCGNPTLVSGNDKFEKYYNRLQKVLTDNNITTVITACMNCYNTIKKYSPSIKVISLWEVLAEKGLPYEFKDMYKNDVTIFTIHDPCPSRYNFTIHDSIRSIITELGINFVESPKSRQNTDCCGAGGMIGVYNNTLFKDMVSNRLKDLVTDNIICYCESCTQSLNSPHKNVVHLLDLLFNKNIYMDSPYNQSSTNFFKQWSNRYKITVR